MAHQICGHAVRPFVSCTSIQQTSSNKPQHRACRTPSAAEVLQRRHVLGLLSASSLGLGFIEEANAAGLEMPNLPDIQLRSPPPVNIEKSVEEQIEQSEFLKALKERSDKNKLKNKIAIQDKYCRRQAELGIGDCGGLQLIPGATKSGKQKTPGWLNKLLGKEQQPDRDFSKLKGIAPE